MNTKTLVVTMGTAGQVLAFPAIVRKISVSGTAGTIMNFYDTTGTSLVQGVPAATLVTKTDDNAFVRTNSSTPSNGIEYDYSNTGVGYGTDHSLAVGGDTLQPVATRVNGDNCDNGCNLVIARGLRAVMSGGGSGETATVIVEYLPSISLAAS